MPRPPSSAARFGTRFHAWVEARFGQQPLLDPDDLPGRADSGIDDESDLQELVKRFEAGPFADRVPHAVEAPFALVLDGQVVRGRIDAVYAEQVDGEPGYLLVDWKTNRAATADPLQLAVYRVAWAELTGVPLDRVRAVFYYVRTGEVVEPDGLPDRAGLAAFVSGPAERRAGRPHGWLKPARSAISTMCENVCCRSSRRRLLAGDDVVGHRADRQRPPAEPRGLACRARSPPSRPRARRGRPSGRSPRAGGGRRSRC